MYRINKLKRNVLITPDEVIFHAATDQDISERSILPNIIIAEERWIANTICDKFYEDFINQKNREVTAENRQELLDKINETLTKPITEKELPIGTIVNAIELVENEWYVKLWNRFLWKLTAECVDAMSVVPSWLKHTSSGQQLNNPKVIGGNMSGAASGEMKEVQFKLENYIQDRIDPIIERMKLWICQNKSNFPLFCKDCGEICGCDENGNVPDGVSHIRKTNFITNIYEDYESN